MTNLLIKWSINSFDIITHYLTQILLNDSPKLSSVFLKRNMVYIQFNMIFTFPCSQVDWSYSGKPCNYSWLFRVLEILVYLVSQKCNLYSLCKYFVYYEMNKYYFKSLSRSSKHLKCDKKVLRDKAALIVNTWYTISTI